jgi:hypothetical protein
MKTQEPTSRSRSLQGFTLIVAAATTLLLFSPTPARSLIPHEPTLCFPTPQKILLAQLGREDERLRRKYEQWQQMSPQEKEMIRRRMDQWNRMTPRDRQRYQRRYDQWQHLSPEERGQINRKLEEWDNLSPQEKEGVRSRFR